MSDIQQSKTHLLIGAGRLAFHLNHYFSLVNVKFKTWNRSQGIESLEDLIAVCDKIWICITDSEIENFLNMHRVLFQKKQVFHCSGSLVFDSAIGVHPLMTFPKDKLYSLEVYKKIPLIVDQNISISEIDVQLSNTIQFMPKELKSLYHALCVVGGNFPQMLAALCEDELNKMSIKQDWFRNYLTQSIENYVENGKSSLTGPLIRKDRKTIDRNLIALKNTPLEPIYKAMEKVML